MRANLLAKASQVIKFFYTNWFFIRSCKNNGIKYTPSAWARPALPMTSPPPPPLGLKQNKQATCTNSHQALKAEKK